MKLEKKKKIFSHIEFQTAPLFRLLIVVLLTFILCNIFVIKTHTSFALAVSCSIFGLILAIIKHKTLAFHLLGISIGFLIFCNSDSTSIRFSDKIVPRQRAMVSGIVKQILKQDSVYTRLIVSGWVDTKYLPKLNNSGVILNVYGVKEIEVGDHILANCRLRPPRNKVFEYDFDERQYSRGLGVDWIATVSSDKILITQKANYIYQLKNKSYTALSDRIDKLFDINTASFVKAVLIADKSNLSSEIKEIFSISGVAHILALSGLHIGVISGILLALLSFFPINRWVKFSLFSVLVIVFIFFTGMQDSTIRAGSMSILIMFGYSLQREVNSLNIISIVLLATMLISPSMLYSISFQMSLLSIVGIFIFLPIFQRAFFLMFRSLSKVSFFSKINYDGGIYKFFINSISLTLSASIVINPLTAYYFSMLSIISPLVNLIIVPLFSLGLVFTVITVLFSYIYFPIATIYAGCVDLIFNLCIIIAKYAASFEFSAVIDSKNLTLFALATSCILFYIVTSRRLKHLAFRLIVSTFCFTMLYFLFTTNDNNHQIEIYPKETYCLLSLPLENNKKYVWIADRMPNQKYYNDLGLQKYFKKHHVEYVCISGNFGKEFAEQNLDIDKYKVRHLSFAQQRELEKRYLAGQYISQINVYR